MSLGTPHSHFEHTPSGPSSASLKWGSAYTLTILAGLLLPNESRGETKTESTPANSANASLEPAVEPAAVIPAAVALRKEQRLSLLSEINQRAAAIKRCGRDPVWIAEFKSELQNYRESLVTAEDFSTEEYKYASKIVVYHLNVLKVYNALPDDIAAEFIAENILTIHAAILDRALQSRLEGCENENLRLLGDLLWSNTFKVDLINTKAAELYGKRIFNCSDDCLPHRLMIFQRASSSYESIFNKPQMLEGFLDFVTGNMGELYSKEIETAIQNAGALFLYRPIHLRLIENKVRESILSEKLQPALFSRLGPIYGRALISAVEEKGRAERMVSLATALNSALDWRSQQEGVGIGSEFHLLRLVMRNALTGEVREELGGIRQPTTELEMKRNESLRFKSLKLALGVLAGIDSLEASPEHISVTAVRFRGVPQSVMIQIGECFTEEEMDGYKQLVEARESLRTALGLNAAQAWSDDVRALVVASLMESDDNRYKKLNASQEYAEWRREELANYFPDVMIARSLGRYTGKVGGVRYFPPVQVEGHPSAYADLYFYLREAMVSQKHGRSWLGLKEPDEELDLLARNYSEARQKLFLSSLLTARLLHIEKLNGEPDGEASRVRAVKTVLNEFKDFGCYKRDINLKLRLESAADFKTELQKISAEALLVVERLEPKIEELLK